MKRLLRSAYRCACRKTGSDGISIECLGSIDLVHQLTGIRQCFFQGRSRHVIEGLLVDKKTKTLKNVLHTAKIIYCRLDRPPETRKKDNVLLCALNSQRVALSSAGYSLTKSTRFIRSDRQYLPQSRSTFHLFVEKNSLQIQESIFKSCEDRRRQIAHGLPF